MASIGHVALLVRYPVKSMAGEILPEASLAIPGLAGDRMYAFRSSSSPPGMRYLAGQERREMLRYMPGTDRNGVISVTAPSGETFAVDSPLLIENFRHYISERSDFRLVQSSTPQTDVRPLSLISLKTIEKLSTELGHPLDHRRFRSNIVLDLSNEAFAEDHLEGKRIQIGSEATLRVLERDPRCRFITYDPDSPHTEEPLFAIMKLLDKQHQGRAGVYARVETPGIVHSGDLVDLLEE
jgi:uncharacterized protein YcbX